MVEKIVPCYPTHREGHPSLYEDYHEFDDFPTSRFVTICSGEQYRRATSCGMWYFSLKASILVGESTKCLNLPI